MSIIYKITNITNGKSYIGKTKRTIKKRLVQHFYESKKVDNKFYRAIKKYGQESFITEIIEEVNDEILNEREIFWIAHFDSVKNGYNSSNGGDGYSDWSEESKAKMRGANNASFGKPGWMLGRFGQLHPSYGKKLSSEHLKIVIESNTGKNSHRFGYHYTEKEKEIKRKAINNLKWINDGNKNKRIPKCNLVPEGWKLGRTNYNSEYKQNMKTVISKLIWINDGIKSTRINIEELEKYVSQGFKRGRMKFVK